FAGIGGIEAGMSQAGHEPVFFCEIDELARRVLQKRFPKVPIAKDIKELKKLPKVDLVTTGFPCTDLSSAGKTIGIDGIQSGLICQLFRLLRVGPMPSWIFIENVPFMLQLNKGRAIEYITDELSALGYEWAYRVVDTRSFGLPQRRRRVLLLASL